MNRYKRHECVLLYKFLLKVSTGVVVSRFQSADFGCFDYESSQFLNILSDAAHASLSDIQ